jgi:hypothetical protein
VRKNESDQKVADAHARAEEAIRKAEQERSARAAIELRIAGPVMRVLNNRSFVEKMSAFKGMRADISARGDTMEIEQISRLLMVTLFGAGWDVSAWQEAVGSAYTSFQIFVKDDADSTARDAANAISETLASVDIWGTVNVTSDGQLVDWTAPLQMPSGEIRSAAPIRIMIGSPLADQAQPARRELSM